MYSGYGTTFDGAGAWNFGNDLAKNVVIFRIGNSSPSHTNNPKNSFLALGEDQTYGIDKNSPEK